MQFFDVNYAYIYHQAKAAGLSAAFAFVYMGKEGYYEQKTF